MAKIFLMAVSKPAKRTQFRPVYGFHPDTIRPLEWTQSKYVLALKRPKGLGRVDLSEMSEALEMGSKAYFWYGNTNGSINYRQRSYGTFKNGAFSCLVKEGYRAFIFNEFTLNSILEKILYETI